MAGIGVWLGWLRLFETSESGAWALQELCAVLGINSHLDPDRCRLLVESPLANRKVEMGARGTPAGLAEQVLPLLRLEVEAAGAAVVEFGQPDLRLLLLNPGSAGRPGATYSLGAPRKSRQLGRLVVDELSAALGASPGVVQFRWPGAAGAPRVQSGCPAVAVVLPETMAAATCARAITWAAMRFLAPGKLARLCHAAATRQRARVPEPEGPAPSESPPPVVAVPLPVPPLVGGGGALLSPHLFKPPGATRVVTFRPPPVAAAAVPFPRPAEEPRGVAGAAPRRKQITISVDGTYRPPRSWSPSAQDKG